jgi:hypothetical protein
MNHDLQIMLALNKNYGALKIQNPQTDIPAYGENDKKKQGRRFHLYTLLSASEHLS